MPRRLKSIPERIADLEENLADLSALVEEVYALLSVESVLRLHAKGYSVKEIAEAMGRQMPYVRKVLKDAGEAPHKSGTKAV